MELSHKSEEFVRLTSEVKDNLRRVLSIPDDFEIMFTQGGAEMQHSALWYNLTGAHKNANYLLTGARSV